MNSRPINISMRLVAANIQSDKHVKALALYYKLKAKYANGKVYNYSPANLSPKIGVSAYLVANYVKILLDLELAKITTQYDRYTKTNIKVLLLESTKNAKYKNNDRFRRKIAIKDTDTLKDITFRLKSVCVENYLKQQQYVAQCKADKIKLEHDPNMVLPLKRVKKIMRLNRGEFSEYTYLSSRKAKSRFGINQSDFKKYKSFTFQNYGWIWDSNFRDSRPCSYYEYEYVEKFRKAIGMVYWYKGYLYTHRPSIVHLPVLSTCST